MNIFNSITINFSSSFFFFFFWGGGGGPMTAGKEMLTVRVFFLAHHL